MATRILLIKSPQGIFVRTKVRISYHYRDPNERGNSVSKSYLPFIKKQANDQNQKEEGDTLNDAEMRLKRSLPTLASQTGYVLLTIAFI
jgi:hypothetical protein